VGPRADMDSMVHNISELDSSNLAALPSMISVPSDYIEPHDCLTLAIKISQITKKQNTKGMGHIFDL
jgi:hypothetical protein